MSRRSAPPRGSLTIVGTGIVPGLQTTIEAKAAIAAADQVLFLVNSPVAEAWIRRLSPTARSLAELHVAGKPRREAYARMTEMILDAVRAGRDVCVAFYGHPGVFVRPAHAALRQARAQGYPARMLPGVSAEDCLFADLSVDPATGCQSFECDDFLTQRRRFDPACSLVLWQVGAIGQPLLPAGAQRQSAGVAALVDRLSQHYPMSHEVVIYEAADLPLVEPLIERLPLGELIDATVTPRSTLYLPPLSGRPDDGVEPAAEGEE